MTRFLLTGANNFIGGHVLDLLLARGHSVVATVGSSGGAYWIKKRYPDISKARLDYTITKDTIGADAFHNAVISHPPFEAVIHTDNPVPVQLAKNKYPNQPSRPLIGSTRILEAIKRNAPTVKRVVITSSLSAIVNPFKNIAQKYSEADWNPVAEVEASESMFHFLSSRKVAIERDAWDWVEKEKPNFTLTSCIPAPAFGPMSDFHIKSISGSNLLILDLITGAAKEAHLLSRDEFFVDVRDVALSHVLAAEKKEAAGKRFLIVADKYSIRRLAESIGENFPQLRDKLPTKIPVKPRHIETSNYSAGSDLDNRGSVEELGMTYRPFETSIVDTVKSWQGTEIIDLMAKRLSARSRDRYPEYPTMVYPGSAVVIKKPTARLTAQQYRGTWHIEPKIIN